MLGFNLRCGSHEVLASSSKYILWVQIEGLIPQSAKVQPRAPLCSLNTLNNSFSCSSFNCANMTIGKFSS